MSEAAADRLLDRAMAADFRDWYRDRRRREHAREGNFHYNGPRDPPPAAVHYPSSLLKCHRKRRYGEANAPAEEPESRGHFWVGRSIETDLVQPFLEERVAGPDEFVTRGIGFETAVATGENEAETETGEIEEYKAETETDTVEVGKDEAETETGIGTLRLRGRTDPVVTTEEGAPLLPTEVKSQDDLSDRSEPSESHRAQVHAALHALSKETGARVEDALLIYVSKSTLAYRVFHVSFEESFWRERVIPWMQRHTKARTEECLPPADPEGYWECTWCDFRRRCGQADQPVIDLGPVGFLPLYEYPRQSVEAHLEATEASLTPTLAAEYPDLASTAPVSDWTCPACGEQVPFEAVEWSGAGDSRPNCPSCGSAGDHVSMRGPLPASGWDVSDAEQ